MKVNKVQHNFFTGVRILLMGIIQYWFNGSFVFTWPVFCQLPLFKQKKVMYRFAAPISLPYQ